MTTLILLGVLLLLRVWYAFGEGTTEGFTWLWINQLEKKPALYHKWRELGENMGRRLEFLLLFVLLFGWIGIIYCLFIEIIALCIYELRLRKMVYGTIYVDKGYYEIEIVGKLIRIRQPRGNFFIFLAGFLIMILTSLFAKIEYKDN